VVDRFTIELRDQTDVDQLTVEVSNVIRETLHPVGLGIWLSNGD